MDNRDRMNQWTGADESRALGAEELNEVTGGAGTTNNMLCPRCKTGTPHTPTTDGRYACDKCNLIHKKI